MAWLTPEMGRLFEEGAAVRRRFLDRLVYSLEPAMARHLLTIALARVLPSAARGFPRAEVALAGEISERLADHPALAVEERLAQQLAASRRIDREAGGASLGVHRSDFIVRIGPVGMPANRASTGEQKVLLLSLVLAQTALLAERFGFAPLLLLDEPLANLDGARRSSLLAILAAGPWQVLLTGTEAEPFRPLAPDAEFLRAGAGSLVAR